MVKKIFNYCLLIVFLFTVSCKENGNYVGMDFRIFKNSKAWELAKAVKNEDIEQIRYEAKKVPVDFQDSTYGNTLLMVAVMNNKEKSVKTLLELGANPNKINDTTKHEGNNAVILACDFYTTSVGILKDLLDYGGDPNSYCHGVTKFDVDEYRKYRRSALTYASENSLPKTKLLVERGADVNQKKEGDCPDALVSAMYLNMKTALYLLEQGCKCNCNFERDSTQAPKDILYMLRRAMYPIDSEEYKDKMKVVEFLKKQGLDYWNSEIPELSIEDAKHDYPETWQNYLKVY